MIEAPPRPDQLLAWPPVMFVVSAAIGVVMRFAMVGLPVPLPFDHLLHAHSHVLYFGWAGMAVLAVAVAGTDATRWGRAALRLVPVMGLAFLIQGYGPASIAMSALVMLTWYGAMAAWWKEGRRDRAFVISLGYVVVAGLGVWALAGIQALGPGDGLAARLAIHAFLSTFAWSLVLGAAALAEWVGLTQGAATRRVMTWFALGTWLLFPLGVVGGPETPVLGWLSRVAAVAVIPPATWWIRELWNRGGIVRAAGLWLGLAVGGLVASAIGGSSLLVAAGRPGVVFYLHALLLGHVTTLLAWSLSMKAGLDNRRPLAAHHVGVAVMLAGIALPMTGFDPAIGNWVAAGGALITWLAGCIWATKLVFAHKRAMARACARNGIDRPRIGESRGPH